jgi:hypothetical protein
MGFLGRYLSGLCVAALGLCAASWLLLTPLAFGDQGTHHHEVALTDRATAGGLAVVSLFTLICWVLAWRRKLRGDGALPGTSRRQARREARELRQRARGAETEPANTGPNSPDPAQVLSELRALLIPLLTEAPDGRPAASAAPAEVHHHGAVPPPRNELDGFPPRAADLDDFQHAPDAARGYPVAPDNYQPVSGEPDYYQPVVSDGYQPSPAAQPAPVTADTPVAPAGPPVRPGPPVPSEPPAPSGIAAIESMLAGAELLTVGCGEEEAW